MDQECYLSRCNMWINTYHASCADYTELWQEKDENNKIKNKNKKCFHL